MSQAATVTRLALREMWISFRLLFVLVAFIGAGAVVALLPAAPSVALERLALGFGLATAVTSAIAAWSVADERTSGRAGWLVARSVSRATYLRGWFAALAAVALVGIGAGALLGWMAAANLFVSLDLPGFMVAVAAVSGTVAAAIALGIAAGSFVASRAAATGALLVCVAVGAITALLPSWAGLGPGAAYLALARAADADPVLAYALKATGIGLTLAAILLIAARMAMERAEL
jgi:hypothetical protein